MCQRRNIIILISLHIRVNPAIVDFAPVIQYTTNKGCSPFGVPRSIRIPLVSIHATAALHCY